MEQFKWEEKTLFEKVVFIFKASNGLPVGTNIFSPRSVCMERVTEDYIKFQMFCRACGISSPPLMFKLKDISVDVIIAPDPFEFGVGLIETLTEHGYKIYGDLHDAVERN